MLCYDSINKNQNKKWIHTKIKLYDVSIYKFHHLTHIPGLEESEPDPYVRIKHFKYSVLSTLTLCNQ